MANRIYILRRSYKLHEAMVFSIYNVANISASEITKNVYRVDLFVMRILSKYFSMSSHCNASALYINVFNEISTWTDSQVINYF